jgi:hypothetical protein
MHRVELKVNTPFFSNSTSMFVPNAPCGVESVGNALFDADAYCVPNAPCGVESQHTDEDDNYNQRS